MQRQVIGVVEACGGGYLPHRFSKLNGFDNPSVYCADLYATLDYIQSKLTEHVYIKNASGEKLNIGEAVTMASRSPRDRLAAS